MLWTKGKIFFAILIIIIIGLSITVYILSNKKCPTVKENTKKSVQKSEITQRQTPVQKSETETKPSECEIKLKKSDDEIQNLKAEILSLESSLKGRADENIQQLKGQISRLKLENTKKDKLLKDLGENTNCSECQTQLDFVTKNFNTERNRNRVMGSKFKKQITKLKSYIGDYINWNNIDNKNACDAIDSVDNVNTTLDQTVISKINEFGNTNNSTTATKFVGCFNDRSGDTLSRYGNLLKHESIVNRPFAENCRKIAVSKSARFFATQGKIIVDPTDPSKDQAKCFITNNYYKATSLGPASCSITNENLPNGGENINALYYVPVSDTC